MNLSGFVCYLSGLRSANVSVFFPLLQTQPLFALTPSAVVLADVELLTCRTVISALAVGGSALVVMDRAGQSNLASRNGSMWGIARGSPWTTRSAVSSPVIGDNWKPFPLNPVATK